MNSFLVIAVLVLTGFSFASAASLNFGDDKLPELIEDFEESVQSLLRGAAEQLKDLNSVDDLDVKTKHVRDQSPVVTVEEEKSEAGNISPSEHDNTGFCAWHGHIGVCCKKTSFLNTTFIVCVRIIIKPNVGMHVRVVINKHHIVDHFLYNHKKYAVCVSKGHLQICLIFHNVLVTSDHAQACLVFTGKYRDHLVIKRLGCVVKKFSVIETADESLMKLIQAERNEDISSLQEEDMKIDEVLNFKQ